MGSRRFPLNAGSQAAPEGIVLGAARISGAVVAVAGRGGLKPRSFDKHAPASGLPRPPTWTVLCPYSPVPLRVSALARQTVSEVAPPLRAFPLAPLAASEHCQA